MITHFTPLKLDGTRNRSVLFITMFHTRGKVYSENLNLIKHVRAIVIVVIASASTYFDASTGTEDELVFSHQFGADIREYSSQYGSVEGVSYTAKNLVGTATRYPAYGDYPETYVPVIIQIIYCNISLT